MVSVLVVQMPVHQVVHVVPMRHSFVAALRPVLMLLRVPSAIVPIGAIGRIGRRHLQRVFIHMSLMQVVQVTVMQEIHMVVVPDRGMSAFCPVLVCMLFMNLVICHR